MKKKKLLIIGSNFGINHCKAAMKKKKFNNISIASPKIHSKNIPNGILKYTNAEKAINKKEFYDMISIATKPRVQNNLIKLLSNKNLKYLLLEKPLQKETIDILKKFPNKTLFLTNFIFSFDKKWKLFKSIVKKTRKTYFFEYEWYFKQAYFINKKKTWKIKNTDGGGLINYYLPHAIFNILNNFKNVKFYKINKTKYFKKKLIFLEILFTLNNNISRLRISNNSNKNLHKLKFSSGNNLYSLYNTNKDWLSNFKIIKNKKEIFKNQKTKFTKDSRICTLIDVYKNIPSYFNRKNIETNKELTYKTFELINKINKKLNESYF